MSAAAPDTPYTSRKSHLENIVETVDYTPALRIPKGDDLTIKSDSMQMKVVDRIQRDRTRTH